MMGNIYVLSNDIRMVNADILNTGVDDWMHDKVIWMSDTVVLAANIDVWIMTISMIFWLPFHDPKKTSKQQKYNDNLFHNHGTIKGKRQML